MKRLISCGFMLLSLALATSARAAAPQAYSKYEQETINEVLKDQKTTIDPAPEGKIVEGIDIVPLEVFEQRDPLPGFVNIFHTTTRKYVIARQVLQSADAPYEQAVVDETARNLRTNAQLSIVICLPVAGSAPGRVRLLVIT